jgi:hypothetical protein
VLDGDLARHLDQTALAHGVGEGAGRPDHPVLRGDVDDPPADLGAGRFIAGAPHPVESE